MWNLAPEAIVIVANKYRRKFNERSFNGDDQAK